MRHGGDSNITSPPPRSSVKPPPPPNNASKSQGTTPGQLATHPASSPEAPRTLTVDANALSQSLERATSTPQNAPPTPRTRADVLGSKKQTRFESPSELVSDLAEEVTRTSRTTRIKNLFPTSGQDSSLTENISKLLEVAMAAIVLGRQTKKVQVDVNSAADILVLIGAVHDHHQLDLAKRSVFQPGRKTAPTPPQSTQHTTTIAQAVSLDFQTAGVMDKLTALATQVSTLTSIVQGTSPTAPKQDPAPSYALAASKHAPSTAQTPTRHPTRDPGRPKARQTFNTLVLTERSAEAPMCTSTAPPRLVITINTLIKESKIKLKPTNKTTIQVKTIQHRPSNNIVLHLKSQGHARSLSNKVADWLPKLSPSLEMKPARHALLVHGIPTSFDPAINNHLEDLIV